MCDLDYFICLICGKKFHNWQKVAICFVNEPEHLCLCKGCKNEFQRDFDAVEPVDLDLPIDVLISSV
jgi:hypothetical protein